MIIRIVVLTQIILIFKEIQLFIDYLLYYIKVI